MKNNYRRETGNEGKVVSRDKKYLRIVEYSMNVTSVASARLVLVYAHTVIQTCASMCKYSNAYVC